MSYVLGNFSDFGQNLSTGNWSEDDWLEFLGRLNDTYMESAALAPESVVSIVIFIFTIVVGVVGNILILVAVNGKLQDEDSPINIFLGSLAAADLLLICVCLPSKILKLTLFTWSFGQFCCKLVHYLEVLSVFCSVINLTVISIERYYAVVHPLRARTLCSKERATKVTILVWIGAAVLSVPNLFVMDLMEVGFKRKAYWCVPSWDSPDIFRFHEVYLFVFILVLPGCVMLYSYIAVLKEIKKMSMIREEMKLTVELKRARVNMSCEAEDIPESDTFLTDAKKNDHREILRLQADCDCAHSSGQQNIVLLENEGYSRDMVETQISGNIINPKVTELGEMENEHESSMNAVPRILLRKSFEREPMILSTSNSIIQEREDIGEVTSGGELYVNMNSTRDTVDDDEKTDELEGNRNAYVKDKPTEKTEFMLILVMTSFTFCWAPLLVFNVIGSFGVYDVETGGTKKYFKLAFSLLAYMNSCMNPVIYGFLSKNFRTSFKKTCCSFRCRSGSLS